MRARCRAFTLLAAVLATSASAQSKPWDDPDFGKPDHAAKREALEYTEMFNHQVARPPRYLRFLQVHPDAYRTPESIPPTLLLGDLLFHAPRLLGPHAALFGLSCSSCHPSGATSTDIFVGPESDRPGNVDLLSNYFTPLADDGIYAPRNVPSLRGLRYTGPYERDGSKSSLAEVITGVVSREFAQPLRSDWLNALELYVSEFDFLPNDRLDEMGRLTARATPAAHRGESLFREPRAQFAGLSCAGCHVPNSYFTDHLAHRFHHGIGEGSTTPEEGFDTPTLLNSAESPPYFFDGSAPTLAAAVAQIDSRSHLALSSEQQADLTAFLDAVGAVDVPPRVPKLGAAVEEAVAYLALLDEPTFSDDAQLWSLCLDTVRHLLVGALRVADTKSRTLLEPRVVDFERFVAGPAAIRPSDAARAELRRLHAQLVDAAARASGEPPRESGTRRR